MNRASEVKNHQNNTYRWQILWCLLLSLLMGCNVDNSDEKTGQIGADHGMVFEVNGEKFRIANLGGVRFRFPDNYTFVVHPHVAYMHLNWPDIPPGKASDKKLVPMKDAMGKTNSVEVLISATNEPVKIEADKSKVFGLPYYVNPDDYIVRDDLKLGLRIFSSKETPNYPSYAYSLNNDALTPVDHKPVIVSDNYIYFYYAPRVEIRINMWVYGSNINPNWKEIYLGVIETLNKYREVKK